MDTLAAILGIVSIWVVVRAQTVITRTEQNVTLKEALPVYRVTTVLNEPWMMKTEDGSFEGFLVDLLNEITALSNFSYIIKETPNSTYGRIKYTDGEIHVNGIIGEIISGDADLGVADLIISDVRSNVVSFSAPFATTGAQILLLKPDSKIRGLAVVFIPFSASLWICTLAAILFTTLVIYLTERFQQSSPAGEKDLISKRLNLCRSFQFTILAFVLRGPRHMQAAVPTRIISLCWWWFTIVILASYTASLTCYLISTSNSKPVIPFKTFEEMVGQSDIEYGGWFDMALDVNDNVQKAVSRHINSKYTHYSDMPEAVKRVLDRENDFAAIVDGFDGQKAANENCELILLQEQLFEMDYGIACAHDTAGEALCFDISMAIAELREDGTLYRFMNKWWGKSKTCETVPEKDYTSRNQAGITNFRPLDIKDMFVTYVVLFIGMLLSFALTLILKKFEKKKPHDERNERQVGLDGSHNNQEQKLANSVPDLDQYKDVSSLEATEDYPDIDAP